MKNPKTFTFDVFWSGEPGAGIYGGSETVKITFESGELGGEEFEQEFAAQAKDFIKEWHDCGATVLCHEIPADKEILDSFSAEEEALNDLESEQ